MAEFKLSARTVVAFLNHGGATQEERTEELFDAARATVESLFWATLTIWCTMRCYDEITFDLRARGEAGFLELLAHRSGFGSSGLGPAGDAVLDDIAAWLAEGGHVDGGWGHLELTEDQGIVAVISDPLKIMTDGFRPSEEKVEV